MKAKGNSSLGFTFVETLMAIFIFSVIMTASYVTLLSGTFSWQINNTEIELQQELRKAVDWMAEDLRQAGTSSITNVPADGVWYATITFKISAGVNNGNILWAGSSTQYLLGGTGSTQLQRKIGSQTQVIAQNIASLQIRREAGTPKIVEVALRAEKRTPEGHLIQVSSNFNSRLRN